MKNYYKKYTLDVSFFDQIDSPEKAYILGFLYADGCNDFPRGFKIQLSECDKDHLKKISDCLKSSSPIKYSEARNFDKKYKSQPSYTLRVNSRKFSRRLIELGCPPNKTFKIQFPTEEQIPLHLLRHFIRGYFDGDGSIHCPIDKKGCIFTIIGTQQFINSTKLFLESKLQIKVSTNKYKKHSFWTLQCGSIPNIKKILDYLYQDSTIHLERKYKKYLDLVNIKYPSYLLRGHKFANKSSLSII